MNNYSADLNSGGRGRGIASFYNENFEQITNINCEGFSISKLESKDTVVIGVYRSQGGSLKDMVEELIKMIDKDKTTIIGGDMNVCVRAHPENYLTKTLTEIGFQQVITESTHIDGGAIDHIYICPKSDVIFKWIVEYFPKYYSDHDAVGLILRQDKEG